MGRSVRPYISAIYRQEAAKSAGRLGKAKTVVLDLEDRLAKEKKELTIRRRRVTRVRRKALKWKHVPLDRHVPYQDALRRVKTQEVKVRQIEKKIKKAEKEVRRRESEFRRYIAQHGLAPRDIAREISGGGAR